MGCWVYNQGDDLSQGKGSQILIFVEAKQISLLTQVGQQCPTLECKLQPHPTSHSFLTLIRKHSHLYISMSCAVPYTQLCHAHRCATRGGVPHLHAFSPPMMPCEANCLHSYQLPSCLACWLLHAHCVLPFQRCPTSDLSYDLSAPQLPAV